MPALESDGPDCAHRYTDMTDELGFGAELMRQGNIDILNGRKTFRSVLSTRENRDLQPEPALYRDAFKEMLDSVAAKHSFEYCIEELRKSEAVLLHHCTCSETLPFQDIKLDSGFKEFFAFCKENDIPVVIVSRSAYARVGSFRV